MTTLVAVLEAFAAKYAVYEEPPLATNQCSIACEHLIADLAEAGVPAIRVRVRGHRRAAAAMEMPTTGPTGDHWIVLADDCFIDFTRRQFEPSAPVPTTYDSIADLALDWLCIEVEDGAGFQALRSI